MTVKKGNLAEYGSKIPVCYGGGGTDRNYR